jgi:hypothetical protein
MNRFAARITQGSLKVVENIKGEVLLSLSSLSDSMFGINVDIKIMQRQIA